MGAARILATFFGAGLFPKIPGTAGTLASLALWAPLLYFLPRWGYAAAVISSAPLWLWAGHAYLGERRARGMTGHDPREIVCDEVFGMGLALMGLPFSWKALLAAFILFRLFDIVKPPPVRQLERLSGAWGVMADDAAAGLLACACAQAALRGLP